eukprot:6459391-Amphidinium_carterae.1
MRSSASNEEEEVPEKDTPPRGKKTFFGAFPIPTVSLAGFVRDSKVPARVVTGRTRRVASKCIMQSER